MKKFLKYSMFILPALALIVIIVISCSEENLTKKNDAEPVFTTFSGWDSNTWYDYRIAHPDYFGDSSFLISIYYNSQFQVVRANLSVVAAEPEDSIVSLIFIDYDLYGNEDSLYFDIPLGDEVWIIDLKIGSLMNVEGGPDKVIFFKCKCWGGQPLDTYCKTISTRLPNGTFIVDCFDNDYGCAACNCDGCAQCDCIPVEYKSSPYDEINGPVVIIQSDKLRFNGTLYQ